MILLELLNYKRTLNFIYSNQIKYLAIHYPKFIQNNYFIKNYVKVKNIHLPIKNVVLLKKNILSFLCNKGLIIENKNIIIPGVKSLCLTDENDIIICFTHEYKKSNHYDRYDIYNLKVIKLKENNYEIINTNTISFYPYIGNLVKISNNRYIIYYSETNDITLWKIDKNYSIKYLSKTQILK